MAHIHMPLMPSCPPQADFTNTVAGNLKHANNAAACGLVIISMCNWMLIILLGDMGASAAVGDYSAWEAGSKGGAMAASA